ncbi:MAG: zinc-binding dehydrogenase [Gammaproteobacteria bacterium]|nr:zinc-binding dehydrogenase [Gammaproteobacteria bacterium]
MVSGKSPGKSGRIKGFDAVAVAGSDAKVEWCKAIGYRTGINHRSSLDLTESVAEACPRGVDVFMDNTAGPIHDAAMLNINTFGRVVIVGTVALADRFGQPDIGLRHLRRILVCRTASCAFEACSMAVHRAAMELRDRVSDVSGARRTDISDRGDRSTRLA